MVEKTRYNPLSARDKVVSGMCALPPDQLQPILALALQRELPYTLPLLYFIDEGPCDLFVDFAEAHPDQTDNLKSACISLARKWSGHHIEEIQKNPERYGELLWLSGMVGANEAIPAVARFATDPHLETIKLSGGEDLQSRGLRVLSGLLDEELPEKRDTYRGLYETALENPEHAPIALTTLAAFWPERKDQYITQAKKYGRKNIDWVINNLDLFTDS